MLRSEKELRDVYQGKISAESKILHQISAFSAIRQKQDSGIPSNTVKNISQKRRSRSDLVSVLVAVAFAGCCFALIPVYPYRHFDRSIKILSEVKIEKKQVIEFAQAVSLSFNSRHEN